MAAEKKYLPLTPRIKAQAKALWISGEFRSVRALENHLGVTPRSLQGFLDSKDKGVDAEKAAQKIKDALANDAAEAAVLVQTRARETKDQHYTMANGIAKLTWAEVLKAKTAEAPMSTIAANVKALEIAMSVLKKAREERFAVLGLNDQNAGDDGGLPELIISELTPEQVKSLREMQEDEDYLEEPTPTEDPNKGIVDTTDESDVEELG